VAEAAAGGRNMEVGMDVKATVAATPTAGGLYTSYNGSLTPQQELSDDDGDDAENSSSSKGKLLVASEAAQLEALERRLSVRHLALQFETGQVNSHAEAAANKLAQETTTDHVLEKGSPTVAHSPNAAGKDQEQRGNGHSHHGHHHHHHHHNHTSSTSSHGTAVTTPTTPTAAAAAQTTPKRRQHQCSSHKHATPTTTRFDGAPVLRSSLRRTSGNLRECDRHGPAKDTVKEEVVVTDRTTLTKKLQALLSEIAGRLVGKHKDDAAEILSMVITCLPSVSSFSSSSSFSLSCQRQTTTFASSLPS
jgi:G3E family GTPase